MQLKDEINIVTVEPDIEYIKKLEKRCVQFWAEVQKMNDEDGWIEE